MDLADILRIFYSNSEEYIFISSVHGTFSRIDHILGHKSNLNKFNKIEIVWSIFSDDKAMSLRYQLQEKKTNPGELPDVQAGFRKGRGPRGQIANICWIMEKAREFQKNIYFCFIDYAKAFDCVSQKSRDNARP